MLFLTHTFGHTNSWQKFKLADGCTPLRPFTSTEEMDETMVERWNAVVGEHDTVYHLGDVVINRKSLHHVKRLNGKKRLILGNHDIFKNQDYKDVGFEVFFGVRVFVDQWILSHIPLHPDCITNRFHASVHGHLHANRVMLRKHFVNESGNLDFEETIDPRYLCVSVEHTNFRPLHFDEIEQLLQKQWEETGYESKSGWGNGSSPS